jgi:lipid II:glycine glycyltransferase (peptidoglycan interpeptide bridge formation enzyme)
MKLKKLTDDKKDNYEKIVDSQGIIFNTMPWLKIFGDRIQIYGIYDKGDNLIGGFHLYKQKKFGLTIYCDPPFTSYIGPFLQVKAKNPAAVMRTWKEVLSLMADFFDNLPYSVISVSLNRSIIDTRPFIWKKFKVIPRYTYIIDLEKSIEDIWGNLFFKKRNDIRKAEKDGIVVKRSNDFEIVNCLISKTFLRQKKKKYQQYYINEVFSRFANDSNSFSVITFKNNKPNSGVFCIYDKNNVYQLFSAYDHNNKHHGAVSLSTWESIKYSKELGLKHFDFCGSMIPRIDRNFRQYGGQLSTYYRINKAKLPLEILLKFYKRELF